VLVPDPWGNSDGALYFSGGAANGLDVAGSLALALPNCTFEVWAKTIKNASENWWAVYYNTAPDAFRARQNNSNDHSYGFDLLPVGLAYVRLVTSNDGAWHHLCFSIYDVGWIWYAQFWADGQSFALKALKNYTATDLGSPDHPARIGSGSNGYPDNPFIGSLSNLRISSSNRYGATDLAAPIAIPAAPFVPDADTALLIPF
jgi:hypothetical protein